MVVLDNSKLWKTLLVASVVIIGASIKNVGEQYYASKGQGEGTSLYDGFFNLAAVIFALGWVGVTYMLTRGTSSRKMWMIILSCVGIAASAGTYAIAKKNENAAHVTSSPSISKTLLNMTPYLLGIFVVSWILLGYSLTIDKPNVFWFSIVAVACMLVGAVINYYSRIYYGPSMSLMTLGWALLAMGNAM